jgi:hypothetical protein
LADLLFRETKSVVGLALARAIISSAASRSEVFYLVRSTSIKAAMINPGPASKAATVPSPYILVTHSMAGYNARLYVAQYRSEVPGVEF